MPQLDEESRKRMLEDNGFDTQENYDGIETPPNKKDRLVKLILIFVSAFILALIAGVMVSEFMGPGGILAGLIIGASIGVVITLPPLIMLLLRINHK